MFLLITSCGAPKQAIWTILVYMAADNSLNEAAIDEINEMEAADFSDEINVILQIDSREGNLYNFYPGARRYHIYPDTSNDLQIIHSPVIRSLGEIDSGDPQQLADFVNWGCNNYPADNTALIIWSHGNGWYDAYNRFCPDNDSGNSISVPNGDLAAALYGIYHEIDMLILDACNMQCLEVLAEIGNNADLVIGSETTVCTDGFPYSEILGFWEDYNDFDMLAQEITLTYINSYLPGGSQYQPGVNPGLSVSSFRSEKINDIMDQIENFVTAWQISAGEDYMENARGNCLEYNDLNADVDVIDFFSQLVTEEIPQDLEIFCNDIITLLNQAFFCQQYYNLPAEFSGTATIWFPDTEDTFVNLNVVYNQLEFAETDWTLFLDSGFSRQNMP
ncbi:MAG: hypothetical protein JXB60_04395 [Candidatus Cloacimonetes bacterium]|nr:hypothetical protein [Candidatus Cloacimonadota bacterium]